MKTRLLAISLFSSLALVACESKEPQPPLASPKPAAPAPAPASPHTTAAATDATSANDPVVTLMGVKVTLPSGWKRNPPANQMRLAEADVPDSGGDPAKTCLVVFSTAGGSVEENVTRWSGQVRDATGNAVPPNKSESRTVDGVKVTIVQMAGSFAGMGGGAPKENWALHGAIIETPQGLLFVKMTGPAPSMEAAAAAFNAMFDSLKKS